MGKWLNCNTPLQQLVMLHINENFVIEEVELELIHDGIRLTDNTGAVADFTFNRETGKIDMKELDSEEIKKAQERKKAVQLIQRDLLRAYQRKYRKE